jgi:anti-sigma B factor antagonist
MAFQVQVELVQSVAKITLSGALDASVAPDFKAAVEQAAAGGAKRLALVTTDLEYIASAGIRVFIFAKQKMGAGTDIYVVGAQPQVRETLEMTGLTYSVQLLDAYDAAVIEAVA